LLVDLIELVGRDHALRAYRLSYESLDALPELVDDLGDRCGLARRPCLYLGCDRDDVEKLKRECDARRSLGIAAEFLDERHIRERFSFSRPAALWSVKAMEVDPFRLTHRLVARSVERGLEVFAGTEVEEYEWIGGGIVLTIRDGNRVRARHVVFATGYETPQFLGRDVCTCTLRSTYAMVSSPLDRFDGWPDRCLIWESARPYFYLRTTQDGRAGRESPDAELFVFGR